MELVDPIRGIRDEELAHWPRILAVEVEGLSPIGFVPRREIVGRKRLQEITVRTDMVIHHVEDDSHVLRVRLIDKLPEIIRLPIEPCRSEEVHSIVPPAE